MKRFYQLLALCLLVTGLQAYDGFLPKPAGLFRQVTTSKLCTLLKAIRLLESDISLL